MEPEKEAAQPVTNPPSGPGLDFFHSDPFTDSKICTQSKIIKKKVFNKINHAAPYCVCNKCTISCFE